MNRKVILGILLLATAPVATSQPAPTGAVPEKVRAILQRVDSLVAQQQYESAFQALGTANDDEFLVAKKTEMCLSYFVQSLNHQGFAFKNFVSGDTFDNLRSGTGTYTLVSFRPDEVIGKLISSGKHSPLLYKALGDYYYDVGLRYQGRWIESDEEVAQKAVANYELAYSLGIRDPSTLTKYADRATELGNFPKALDLYKLALATDPSLANASFNIAYTSLRLGNYQEALRFGEQAITRYKDDANYRMDALLLCTDAAYSSQDYGRALGYLKHALEISNQDYRVFQKSAFVNLAKGDLAAAEQNLDQIFALAPTNPGATQAVTGVLTAFQRTDRLPIFFVRNLPKYGNLPEAQANLYFHQALNFEALGDKSQARKSAALARTKFLEAKNYTAPIQEAVEALLARNS